MLQATDVPSSRPNDRRASTGPHPSKENMISNPVTLDVPAYSRSRHRTPSACTNATRPSPSTARCCTSLPTPSAPSPATCSWLASSSACNSPRDRITPPGRPSVRRFNPHLCAHPGRAWKLGKRRSIGRKNTGWKPMLHCFPDCRAISQSRPGSYRRAPGVTTRRRKVALGFQPVFCSYR
jgi:hypothetical protein